MVIDPWVIIGASILLLRAGLGTYLCGLSRTKNTVSTIFRAVLEISVAVLAYWSFGQAVGRHRFHDLFGGFEIGGSIDAFPGLVCVFAAAIAVAPMMERARTSTVLVVTAIWSAVVAPLVWRLAQSDWLVGKGFLDVGGSSFILFAAGVAGLMGAIIVGPRLGKYNRDGSTNVLLGHNPALASVGLLMMYCLWPVYLTGFASSNSIAVASGSMLIPAILAPAAACCAAMLYSHLRYGKLDVSLVYCGLLAGLVAVTGAPDRFSPATAAVIGAGAGLLVPMLEVRLDLFWKIDDPSGFIAVAGFGGLWGTLAAGLFAAGSAADRIHHLFIQLLALAMIGAISAAFSGSLLLLLRSTIGVRVKESDELDGLDFAQHDLNAYPDFQQTLIKSYDLRQL